MVSVVIPSYNRKGCIQMLLRDVLAQRGVDFEVIVVDDCSSDGTPELVAREFPQVRLLRNLRNGGPCVTRNRGILAAHGEIILGFDSDVTVPDRHLIAKASAAFDESPDCSGFAFRILASDGRSDDAPRWWHPHPLARAAATRFETNYFSGTAYAFRRPALVAAGLFPEAYFMHYEEVELALRVIDGGGSIQYRPELTAVHHANPVSRRSEIKVFYKPRNQVLLAWRCFPALRGAWWLAPRLANGLFQATRNKSLSDWWRALRSAHTLAGSSPRRPLARSTWRRLARMGR